MVNRSHIFTAGDLRDMKTLNTVYELLSKTLGEAREQDDSHVFQLDISLTAVDTSLIASQKTEDRFNP